MVISPIFKVVSHENQNLQSAIQITSRSADSVKCWRILLLDSDILMSFIRNRQYSWGIEDLLLN